MERYEKPEMEVIVFDEEEIRTTTGGGGLESVTLTPNSNSLNKSF